MQNAVVWTYKKYFLIAMIMDWSEWYLSQMKKLLK